jgi:hypothetical protein
MSFVRRLTSVIALATLVLASFAQTPQPSNPPPQQQHQKCTDNGTYVNSKGETVKRPENCSGVPQGATAQCRDGSYSFSHSRSGTCSHQSNCISWQDGRPSGSNRIEFLSRFMPNRQVTHRHRISTDMSASVPGSHNRVGQKNWTLARFSVPSFAARPVTLRE